MKSPFFIFLIILVFASQSSKAQDTLTFLDGKVIHCKVLKVDSFLIDYQIKKNQKTKNKVSSTELIYTIGYKNGNTDTLYVTNPDIGNFLTVQEMHYYILGEQDAKLFYKGRLTALIGLGFGAGFGYLLRDGFWVASVPLVYTIGAGISKININTLSNRSLETLSQPAYQEGYIKVARSKKAFNALAGSLIGTLIGVGVGYATD